MSAAACAGAHARLALAACALAVLLGSLQLQLVQSKKPKFRTIIRMERLGNCPEMPDAPNGFVKGEIVPYGRTTAGKAVILYNNSYTKLTKSRAKIMRCPDRNDPNCEIFANWRFGEDTCSILKAKNMLWSPLFQNYNPKFNCPMPAGYYYGENVTLDVEKLQLIKFPETGYWKVSIPVDGDYIPNILCYYFEFSFAHLRVS